MAKFRRLVLLSLSLGLASSGRVIIPYPSPQRLTTPNGPKKLGIGPGTLRLRLNKHVKIIKKPRMTRPPPSVSGGTS